jgi:hypothetical protein
MELFERVRNHIKHSLDFPLLNVYTKEGYTFLQSVGYPCSYVENENPGTFFVDNDDSFFHYQSKIETDTTVTFHNVNISVNNFTKYLDVQSTYDFAYYNKHNCTYITFVNQGIESIEDLGPEYSYIFQYGNEHDMKKAIRRIMNTPKNNDILPLIKEHF